MSLDIRERLNRMARPRKKTATVKKKNTRQMLTCRIPSDIMVELREISKITGISQTDLVASSIRLLLDKKELQELASAVKRANLVLHG